jgi:bifunctional DNA-binding transcriptional regulator/antitoxin component of YhaV-PrlF toxin-antitoxin module
MPIVKVMKHRQVAIPKELFEKLELEVGDYLEAKIEKGKLVYVPKEVIDRKTAKAIEEAFEDIKAGRVKRDFTKLSEAYTFHVEQAGPTGDVCTSCRYFDTLKLKR